MTDSDELFTVPAAPLPEKMRARIRLDSAQATHEAAIKDGLDRKTLEYAAENVRKAQHRYNRALQAELDELRKLHTYSSPEEEAREVEGDRQFDESREEPNE